MTGKVSGPNAMDKTPMYDMPLAIVLGVRGAFYVLGFLAMNFVYGGLSQKPLVATQIMARQNHDTNREV